MKEPISLVEVLVCLMIVLGIIGIIKLFMTGGSGR